MMPNHLHFTRAICAVSVLMLVGGCGGGNDAAAPPTAAATSAQVTPAAARAPGASAMAAATVENLYVPASCSAIKGMVFGGTLAKDTAGQPALDAMCFGAAASGGSGDYSAVLNTIAAGPPAHPEVSYAGVVPSGCSTSGFIPLGYARSYPSRTIAMVPLDVGTPGRLLSDAAEQPTTDMLSIPALFVTGTLDNLSGNPTQYDYVLSARAQGAPWTYVTQPGAKHCTLDSKMLSFIWTWIQATSALRLPVNAGTASTASFNAIDVSKGWLGAMTVVPNGTLCHPQGTDYCENINVTSASISAYSSFTGDKSTAVWLPDEATAKAWLALTLNTDGSPATAAPTATVTRPGAPTTVHVTVGGNARSIAVAATAAPATGGTVTSVSFYATGSTEYAIGTDTGSPYTATWNFMPSTTAKDGDQETYNIYATVTDSTGAVGTSPWMPVTIKYHQRTAAAAR
jgi:hypothetical protein